MKAVEYITCRQLDNNLFSSILTNSEVVFRIVYITGIEIVDSAKVLLLFGVDARREKINIPPLSHEVQEGE